MIRYGRDALRVSGKASRERWTRCAALIATMQRIYDTNARLDAYLTDRPSSVARRRSHVDVVMLNAMLRDLDRRVDQEIDRATAALLRQQLARKMRRRDEYLATKAKAS